MTKVEEASSLLLECVHYHAAAAAAKAVCEAQIPSGVSDWGYWSISLRSRLMRSRHEGLLALRLHLGSWA